MRTIGKRSSEVYPETAPGGGAAVAALRNRNVAAPTILTAPFTPGGSSLIAAVSFTPRVSGILQISATLPIQNGATGDSYAMIAETVQQTDLTVGGGETTSDGWVMGSTTPPVLGGVFVTSDAIAEDLRPVGSNELAVLSLFGITSSPLPLNVPAAIAILLSGPGSHPLAQLAFANLAVMELP